MKIPVISDYCSWLQKEAPVGVPDLLPVVHSGFQTDLPGVYCIGDLTGIPLLKKAVESGETIIRNLQSDNLFVIEKQKRTDPSCIDIVIIGGGPSGVSAAIAASRLGWRYMLIESSQLFHTLHNFPSQKPICIQPDGPDATLNLPCLDGTKETLLENFQQATKDAALCWTNATANCIRPGPSCFIVETNAKEVHALRVIVAIGRNGSARKLDVRGEDLPHVYHRLVDATHHKNEKILVVGGGNSAIEAAIALVQAGNRVTISYRGAAFSRPDARNIALLDRSQKNGSTEILLQSDVTAITQKKAELKVKGVATVIEASAIYILIGSLLSSDFFKRSNIPLFGVRTGKDYRALTGMIFFGMLLYFGKKCSALSGQSIDSFFTTPFYALFLPWHQTLYIILAWIGWLGTLFFAGLFLFENRGLMHKKKTSWESARNAWFSLVVGVVVASFPFALARGVGLFGLTLELWYSIFYTGTILIFGIRRMKLLPNRYVIGQTSTLIGVQTIFLFALPVFILPWCASHGLFSSWVESQIFPDHSYGRAYGFILAWPLFFNNLASGNPTLFWLLLSIIQTFIVIPVIVYLFGKGAYCGWICSCGGLAETLGHELRTKAPHGKRAKQWELSGQLVLFIALALTVLAFVFNHVAGESARLMPELNFAYSLIVDITLAGVIGVGMYFFWSGRVWCRFFCPLAALMHIYARFSRYRIFSRKERCISCSKCTQICHMGIDVMGYAAQGIPLSDVECVRCSACISSCPMDVLSFHETINNT